MSILTRLLTNKISSRNSFIKNSVIAGTIIFSGFGQDVLAKGKSYVAVEPLVCDLVKSIALPSDEVTCLVDIKQDVHDSCFLSTKHVTSSEGNAIDLTKSQTSGSTAT